MIGRLWCGFIILDLMILAKCMYQIELVNFNWIISYNPSVHIRSPHDCTANILVLLVFRCNQVWLQQSLYTFFLSKKLSCDKFQSYCYYPLCKQAAATKLYLISFMHQYPDSKVNGANDGVHLGPAGPRWAPCLPHELCYLGIPKYGIMAFSISVMFLLLPRMPYSSTRLSSAPINHSDIANVGFIATYWYTAVGGSPSR